MNNKNKLKEIISVVIILAFVTSAAAFDISFQIDEIQPFFMYPEESL